VLDIAAELFARNGYRGTNLTLVANRLNVTRQALYHHFASKREILGALFSRLLDKLESAAADAVAHGEGDGARFAPMLRAHLGVVAENRDLVVVLHRERPEMQKLESLHAAERADAYFELFVRAYADDASAGRVRPLDPRTAATAMVAAANGMWSYLDDDAIEPADVVDAVYTALCSGFLEPNGR
jgi:AcrR family transcriptional regulator